MSDIIAAITDYFDIEVFVTPGCPNCPHGVRAAESLAAETTNVTVTVLDVTEFAERAERYQVRSVPTLVVNGDLTIVGVISKDELARRLVELQGQQAEEAIFVSFMKSGRIDDATARLVDGRGIAAFAKLWNGSVLEDRIGLSLVAQNAVEEDSTCLDELVPHILPSVEANDAALRGDTADLLGVIGHESARSALLQLKEDSHEDVAEAAADALENIDERNTSAEAP